MGRFVSKCSAGVVVLALAASNVSADTVTLTPVKDNTLYESPIGNISNGSGEHVFVGENGGALIRRALLAFDLAGSIPAGSTIDAVTLRMNMSRTIAGPQTIEVFRVSADWGEGASDAFGEEGGGTAAAANDATWIHRFFNTSLWTTPGGDFAASASASASVDGLGSYSWGAAGGLVADVQHWLDNPASNFGWILIGNESAAASAKRFDSRESAVVANRPTLVIDFTPPPDCNSNGIDDADDITSGTSADCDADAVPDECEPDTDGDGTIDACDGCPADANKQAAGVCGCGTPDADSDNDGVPDCMDICPAADDNADRDGDGTPDCLDGCPDNPAKTDPGALGCDVSEADSDGDGVPDSTDACAGADDNLDSDGDGTPDCLDGCPDDAGKLAPGACGCGQADLDSDGDGVADCIDNCTDVPNPDQSDADGDGIGDAC